MKMCYLHLRMWGEGVRGGEWEGGDTGCKLSWGRVRVGSGLVCGEM